MSGKWFLVILLAASLAAAYVLNVAFKRAPDYKSLVTEQMKMEFFDYAETIQHVSKLTLATENDSVYYVNLTRAQKDSWQFAIHDKTLIVTVPALLTDSAGQPLTPSALAKSQKTLQEFVIIWLRDKFHTEKDLLVQVHFLNSNS